MKKKGFTLIELIVVVSIIGILSAVMVQNFTLSIQKTRLQVDIQSARVMTNATILYEAEHSESFADALKDSTKDVVEFLTENNYLKDVEDTVAQTGGKYEYDETKQVILIDVKSLVAADTKLTELCKSLSASDKLYVTYE